MLKNNCGCIEHKRSGLYCTTCNKHLCYQCAFEFGKEFKNIVLCPDCLIDNCPEMLINLYVDNTMDCIKKMFKTRKFKHYY